ncbi:MAG TPA: hypothetical protein VIQ24_24280 [Pyrinomonadaceae bacterium]
MKIPRKKTTKKTATARRTMKQRAQAIVDDTSDFYDDHTKRAVKDALDGGDRADIAEMVRRAESGEQIAFIAKDDADDLRTRAEAIINSPQQSKANRTFVRVALEQNFSNLADIVTHAERGEVLAAIKSSPASATTASAGDTGHDDRQAAWKAMREQPRTFTYDDSSRMYEEDFYVDLLNNEERIKGLVSDVILKDDHKRALALLTLLHAAASFEHVDDRRALCISAARACMDDVTDVWGALGAALIQRAATDKPENE